MESKEIEDYLKSNNLIVKNYVIIYLIDTSLEKFTRDIISCVVIQFN